MQQHGVNIIELNFVTKDGLPSQKDVDGISISDHSDLPIRWGGLLRPIRFESEKQFADTQRSLSAEAENALIGEPTELAGICCQS